MLTLTQLSDLAITEGIDLFEGLRLPDGSPLDRNTLINSIMLKCGLNIPNFADPYVMKSAITLWSAQNQYTFEHVAKIYNADYSPIENYDRYEDLSSDHKRNVKDDTTNNSTNNKTTDTDNTVTNNLTTTNNLTNAHTGTDSTTDESKVSAYDSTEYQPENKSTSDLVHGETITDTGTVTNTGSVTTKGKNIENGTNNGTINKAIDEKENTTQKNHIRGNIGVVTATATQMEEYDFIGKYNPYEFLAGLFENSLTLFVY